MSGLGGPLEVPGKSRTSSNGDNLEEEEAEVSVQLLWNYDFISNKIDSNLIKAKPCPNTDKKKTEPSYVSMERDNML